VVVASSFQPFGAACQDSVTALAEDEIGIAIANNQFHQLGIGEVAITGRQTIGIQRRTYCSQLEQRVATQRVSVIAIFIIRGSEIRAG